MPRFKVTKDFGYGGKTYKAKKVFVSDDPAFVSLVETKQGFLEYLDFKPVKVKPSKSEIKKTGGGK